jgi:hypothetical protein
MYTISNANFSFGSGQKCIFDHLKGFFARQGRVITVQFVTVLCHKLIQNRLYQLLSGTRKTKGKQAGKYRS